MCRGAARAPLRLEWRDYLAAEDCLVGVNWSGPRLVGWESTVPEVLNRLAHALGEGPYANE